MNSKPSYSAKSMLDGSRKRQSGAKLTRCANVLPRKQEEDRFSNTLKQAHDLVIYSEAPKAIEGKCGSSGREKRHTLTGVAYTGKRMSKAR